MKLKATVSKLSTECVNALNRIRPLVLERVLVPHLKVSSGFGSGEFYVQKCDFADDSTHAPFCEVRLSGVSLNDNRAAADFYRARDELERVYVETIGAHLAGMGNPQVQLSVSIMLDAPLKGSSLVEGEPEKVHLACLN